LQLQVEGSPLRTKKVATSPFVVRHASLSETSSSSSSNCDTLEVVIFGVGDLRVHDHEGLTEALSNCSLGGRKLLLLFVFDTKQLCNIPGASRHTLDTATMLRSAIKSVEETILLEQKITTTSPCKLQYYVGDTITCLQNLAELFHDVNLHVCDLGEADNSMRYTPYSSIVTKEHMFSSLDPKIKIIPWSCNLRNEPWDDDVRNLPDTYTVYKQKYCLSDSNILQPLPIPKAISTLTSDNLFHLPTFSELVSVEELASLLLSSRLRTRPTTRELEGDLQTGLFSTHWGTINPQFCSEQDVQSCLEEYNNDDEEFLKSSWYQSRVITSNQRSLEHAALNRMIMPSTTKNLLDGEILLRYLSAPLMFGCLSIRQLRKFALNEKKKTGFSFFRRSPLVDAVESREWHRLFAASCMMKDVVKYHYKKENITYKYWRWQGFLCRYSISSLVEASSTPDSQEISSSSFGLVLLHGFGANGAQWEKMIVEMSKKLNAVEMKKISSNIVAFAPDLLGFGQSEKPFLTYTQYLWESYSSAFLKEIVLDQVDQYVIGGNSIGGYTAMACAADESLTSSHEGWSPSINVETGFATASGAPGSGRCRGLVLLNTAGKVFTKEDVDIAGPTLSVAEMTSKRKLPEFSAPPALVASWGGQGLLWYLRPRIQSICVNLYPTNPSAVDDNLCNSILRDSLDPGALAVMISGSKLPPPRTANELLGASFGSINTVIESKWTGPVLIAQGMKDPLNDAVGRANMFQALREGIEIAPLDGGHCPHDELPGEAASAVCDWMSRKKILV